MANPRNHCNCFKSTGTSQFSTALTFSASISTCPGEIINPTNPTVAWWNLYFLAIPNNWYWINHCFPCGRHKVFVVVLKGHFPFVPFTDPNKVILISHKEKSSTDSRMGRTADPCRQRTLDAFHRSPSSQDCRESTHDLWMVPSRKELYGTLIWLMWWQRMAVDLSKISFLSG